MFLCWCTPSFVLQEHASTQVHVLEGRLAELQGQLAAAQKTAEDAASQHKRLLQEKDQQVCLSVQLWTGKVCWTV